MHHSKAFKTEVALAALAPGVDLPQLAARFGVSVHQVEQWRETALQAISTNFADPLHLEGLAERYDPSELLGTIAENLTRGLAMMDDKGYCIYANPALLQMTGYSAMEIRSQPLHDLIHHHYPDGRPFPMQECPIDRALPENFDVRAHSDLFFRKDGTTFPVLCAASPVFKNGKPIATFIEIDDVSKAQEASEALRRSEELFRTLADNMQHFAWMADPCGQRYWFNNRWFEYTGMTLEEAKGWGWEKTHHPDYLDVATSLYRDFMAKGEPWETTFPLKSQHGAYRWFLARVVPIYDESGNVVRWFGTNTDITELKDAQKDLERAAKEKDRYLSLLAHELRNPLAPIRAGLDLLNLLGKEDPKLQRATAVMGRQVAHMTHLIDDLLDVARIASGRVALRKERCDVAEVVVQTAEDYRDDLEAGGISLELSVPPEPVWIEADRTRIAQIMGNLLHNAGKFTKPQDQIRVRLSVDHRPDGDRVIVTVEDTGSGIEADLLPNLFNPFVQAQQGLDRSKGGLGLGLPLAKGLAELHGGRLIPYSAGPGMGATFTLEIPYAPSIGAEAKGRLSRGVLRPLKIVVIDDNKDFVNMLEVALSAKGHQVRTAMTGEAGLEAVRTLEPDAVLCDIGLPGDVNGYGVVRSLRANPAYASLPIVAITGYNQDRDRELSEKAGFDRHLGKPVSLEELEAILQELCG
ncbi:PAS domain-containing sensor histidine kinase [Noviherbaspirillum humi]|uniref:PAS domain-containing sensor histidine kinase n=1 Tax=Noviherbaspirillum humi TaxID=1688639 RepID=UPI0015960E84|nr:PAS domain-containing sensor histidine kinase [Noviherbaspirillum humi]